MDHIPRAAPPFNTEQPVLNLTQTESLEMMGVRERINVREVYVNSWLHKACVLSIQSVFEGPQRHTSLEDPLCRAGLVISDFSLEQAVSRRPSKPHGIVIAVGCVVQFDVFIH